MWFSSFCLLCSLPVSVERCGEGSRWQQGRFSAAAKNQSAPAASLSSPLGLGLNRASCHTDSAAREWTYRFFCPFAWSCSGFQKPMFGFLSHPPSLWQMKEMAKPVVELCFGRGQNWPWRRAWRSMQQEQEQHSREGARWHQHWARRSKDVDQVWSIPDPHQDLHRDGRIHWLTKAGRNRAAVNHKAQL